MESDTAVYDIKMKLIYPQFFFVVCSVIIIGTDCFLNPYPKLQSHNADGDDFGEPLYITQFLEAGKNVEEIQKMAEVTLDELKEFPSYSGSLFLLKYTDYYTNIINVRTIVVLRISFKLPLQDILYFVNCTRNVLQEILMF